MRTFVNVTQISLDGVMERMEDWHFEYVVSTTLTEPEWENSTVIADNVAEHLALIKDATGGNVLTYGIGVQRRLDLTDTRVLGSGVVNLTYRPRVDDA